MKKSLLIHPEELTKKWIDRMVQQGVNILGIHPEGGKHADHSLERLLKQMETPGFRDLIDYAKSRGLGIEYEIHAGSWLLPRDLFDEHPEYFRVNAQGERTAIRNFCVSDPKVLEIVVSRAVTLAKALYGSDSRYYLWLDDGTDVACHCPNCAKLSASDQILFVMNAILRGLRTQIPEAKLAFLAYQSTLTAPTQIRPESGIFLEYAPIKRPFDQPVRQGLAGQKANMQALLEYFGTEDAKALEYWYDNSLFSKWKKPPQPFVPRNDLIPEDIAYYRELGFRNISSFACFLGEDYEALYGEPDISAF